MIIIFFKFKTNFQDVQDNKHQLHGLDHQTQDVHKKDEVTFFSKIFHLNSNLKAIQKTQILILKNF